MVGQSKLMWVCLDLAIYASEGNKYVANTSTKFNRYFGKLHFVEMLAILVSLLFMLIPTSLLNSKLFFNLVLI